MTVTAVLASPGWHRDAACRGENTDVFYPKRERDQGSAKAICARCPVAAQCLDEALRTGESWGVWGGMSPRNRELLLRHPEQAARRVASLRRAAGVRTDLP